MRRGVLIAFAILGLTACGKTERGTPDVGAAASTSPYVATCLETTEAQNWKEAARLCAMALNADPGDAKVKAALDTANQALASEPKAAESQALSTAPESASDAAAEAAEKAEDEEAPEK